MKVNVVKIDFGDENAEVWTLSETEYTGWETDSGTDGYGLSKEKAEYYAKCINEYPRLLQELEKAQQENTRYKEALEEIKEVDYCPMQIVDIIDTTLKPEEV